MLKYLSVDLLIYHISNIKIIMYILNYFEDVCQILQKYQLLGSHVHRDFYEICYKIYLLGESITRYCVAPQSPHGLSDSTFTYICSHKKQYPVPSPLDISDLNKFPYGYLNVLYNSYEGIAREIDRLQKINKKHIPLYKPLYNICITIQDIINERDGDKGNIIDQSEYAYRNDFPEKQLSFPDRLMSYFFRK